MGLFDELGKVLKQVEDGKKPGTTINQPGTGNAGYAKITAWIKRRYKDRIPCSGDRLQQGLQLEQLATEACTGLSAKTKKGFMDYLKKQNYEPLLK
jgi:hypothetical protein